jgi:hypothetical protein
MNQEVNLLRELRLVICGWCFGIALWIAPKNDPEGLIIIESIYSWASRSAGHNTDEKNTQQDVR